MIDILMGLLGGLGIFLYGMHLMSEGLQRVAGDRMKNILAMLTKNRFVGVTLGALVTAVIQSSSATTVMTVGFVNAGVMSLTQAISVIMGANIGTTITAQIIAFKITDYAPFIIAAGAFLALFVKNRKWKLYGEALLGLGFLFFGLYLMSKGVKPLRDHQAVANFFRTFSSNPITAVLAGVVMTCVLQSSSATIGLAIVLAQQGLIDFNGAVPLILGDNIGTTITAQLAALNTSRAARRAAMSHTIFNVMGVIIFLPLVYTKIYQRGIIFITPGDPDNLNHIGHFIANSHMVFNVCNTVIFLGLIRVLEWASTLLIPIRSDEGKLLPRLLEPHLLDSPPIALQLVRKELAHLVDIAENAYKAGMKSVLEYDIKIGEEAHKLEDSTDDFQHAITQYLIDLSERDLSPDESQQLPTLIHSVNDLERVGDHAENLAEITEGMQARGLRFSDEAIANLREMHKQLEAMFPLLKTAIDKSKPQAALDLLAREKLVNRLRKQFDNDHIERLKKGVSSLPAAPFFMDAIHNLEKIGDHLKNVAQTAHNFFTWSKGKTKLPKKDKDDH